MVSITRVVYQAALEWAERNDFSVQTHASCGDGGYIIELNIGVVPRCCALWFGDGEVVIQSIGLNGRTIGGTIGFEFANPAFPDNVYQHLFAVRRGPSHLISKLLARSPQ